ncbi:MAG: multidrug efflux SMR transporter [Deltaproteobacteria bacterium]|uniref:Multidrug efflux SMR transporter n=1 Tax=Candidatus Zymogenus saltonus TaxID=2844893 RepID=A0A9D8KM28_9DELT|nr:multidrug efflux SMR transporter [Candidatus Zymogenus saltonus]
MSWVYLFIAIITEVAGTIFLKLSDGLSKVIPTVSMGILYALSFIFLALCIRKIEVSIAYAIWSGLGTAVISVFGYLLFDESLGALKVVSIMLIIVGVVGLNLLGQGH